MSSFLPYLQRTAQCSRHYCSFAGNRQQAPVLAAVAVSIPPTDMIQTTFVKKPEKKKPLSPVDGSSKSRTSPKSKKRRHHGSATLESVCHGNKDERHHQTRYKSCNCYRHCCPLAIHIFPYSPVLLIEKNRHPCRII